MKKIFLLFGAVLMFSVFAEDVANLPMEEFVAKARRSNPVATYAKLRGTLQHRRRGKPVVTMPVYFGTIIHPDRTLGQLVLDGREGYMLTQGKGSGLTTVKPIGKSAKDNKLGYVGVRASDLMMSFLFCKVEKELDSEILSGMVACRVFMLDDQANKEKIKLWITRDHAFPMKAEFYRYGENKRFRELEAGALSKKNDLYYVRRLRVEGPGWITKIDFDNETSEIGLLDVNDPPSIVVKMEK